MISIQDFGKGMVKFFNATPHSINIISGSQYKPEIRKHVSGEEIAQIPPSGVMLSAKIATEPVRDLGNDIIVARQVVMACDELPGEAKAADYVIVSAMYATAYRQIHGQDGVKLVTIRDLVVDEATGKIIGCRGFALV